MRNWLLPEYIEDVLPPEAARIEALRAALLENFRSCGYELIAPPMLEYLESLLTGTGHDMDLRTFKLVDQLSGRMMGIRADITPQAARIDAHLLNRDTVTRLCYCGTVLHTRPRAMDVTREPLQIGAEIYGHAGIESDLEIQRLLYSTLAACGLPRARLDIGHVGIFRAICRRGGIDAGLEAELHEALEAKDLPTLASLVKPLGKDVREALLPLPDLYGDPSVLDRAEKLLPHDADIVRALADLRRLTRDNHFELSIDLADLRGYHYHSGVVFTAYVPGAARAVALGGRYDEVGKAFGRSRAATGFSMDLRVLAELAPARSERGAIRAPWSAGDGAEADAAREAALAAEVSRLRGLGEVVIQALPGARDGENCERELVPSGDTWTIRKI